MFLSINFTIVEYNVHYLSFAQASASNTIAYNEITVITRTAVFDEGKKLAEYTLVSETLSLIPI